MKLKTTILVLGASAAGSLPAVALAAAPNAHEARTTKLIAKGSSGHAKLRKGGVLKVEFLTVPTDSGYQWAPKSTKKTKTVLKTTGQPTYVPISTCKAGALGCSENEFVSLRAIRKGTVKVTFQLLPPGTHTKPLKTYILTATVS